MTLFGAQESAVGSPPHWMDPEYLHNEELGNTQEELEDVAGEMNMWATLFSLMPVQKRCMLYNVLLVLHSFHT